LFLENVGPAVRLDLAALRDDAEGAVIVVNPVGGISWTTERDVGSFVTEMVCDVFIALQEALKKSAIVSLAVVWSEAIGAPGNMLLEASRGIVQSLQL
jgi:hypothetical protein